MLYKFSRKQTVLTAIYYILNKFLKWNIFIFYFLQENLPHAREHNISCHDQARLGDSLISEAVSLQFVFHRFSYWIVYEKKYFKVSFLILCTMYFIVPTKDCSFYDIYAIRSRYSELPNNNPQTSSFLRD